MIKRCFRCQQDKNIDDFNKASSRADGRASACKKCNQEYLKKHYHSNKEYYIQKSKKTRAANRERISKIKEENPCTDCGNFYPAVCMDYDHVSDDKVTTVSVMVSSKSLTSIMKEIEKCELVCANCHRIRTHKRLSGMV